MDNATRNLLELVDRMGPEMRSLFEALIHLDSQPSGRKLRLIRTLNQYILEGKFDHVKPKTEETGQKGKRK